MSLKSGYCFLVHVALLWATAANSYGQNDSIRQLLKTHTKQDTAYINLLTEYAFSFDDRNYDSTLYHANVALSLSQKLNYSKGKAAAFWLKGLSYYYLDKIDSAKINLEQALPLARESKAAREEGRIYNTLANVARYRGNQSEALNFYFKSLRIKQQIGDQLGAAITLNNIANVYSEEKDWKRALPYYQQSLAIRKKLNREKSAIMLLSTLGENHLQLGRLDSARYYLFRSLGFARQTDDPWGYVHAYYGLINYYQATQKIDSALLFTNLGILEAKKANSLDREVLYQIKKGELLNLARQFSKALALTDSAKYLAAQLKRQDYLVRTEKNRSEALAGLNRFEEAYSSYRQFKVLSDCTQTKAYKESLRARELEYDLAKQKLQAEADRLTFQQQERERMVTLFIVAAVAFTVSILAILFYRNMKFRSRVNQQLEQKQILIETQNKEIQTQNEELQLQQEEITSINEKLEQDVFKRTQELHETIRLLTEQNAGLEQFSYIISHNLRAPLARITGINGLMKLAQQKPDELKQLMALMEQTTVQFEEVIRDLSHIISLKKGIDFSREKITIRPFLDALLKLLEPEIIQTKATVTVQVDPTAEVYLIRSFLHSIFLNLIQNAIKYRSQQRILHLSISAYEDQGGMHLSVSDNGMGILLNDNNSKRMFSLYTRFHPSIEGRGFGLYLVKTQVELMGGTITVTSKPNEGSTFTVSFPHKR